tara:strand:- start:358 stop:840 length:483 start_codon:yes stop_codon:yes gene_type:complete
MKKLIILSICFISVLATSGQAPDLDIEKQLNIILKESAQPDVYIDGKKYHYDILPILDNNKIKSMTVVKNTAELKDDDPFKKYNAPNGLILIETKKTSFEIRSLDGSKDPLIIVDGKVMEKSTLKDINPDNIKSIDVIKDGTAIKEYNAPNGVVIIKLKE